MQVFSCEFCKISKNTSGRLLLKVVTGKSLFFVIGPFMYLCSICLNTRFYVAVLYGNVAFSILVLSAKKRYPSFFKKGFVFKSKY